MYAAVRCFPPPWPSPWGGWPCRQRPGGRSANSGCGMGLHTGGGGAPGRRTTSEYPCTAARGCPPRRTAARWCSRRPRPPSSAGLLADAGLRDLGGAPAQGPAAPRARRPVGPPRAPGPTSRPWPPLDRHPHNLPAPAHAAVGRRGRASAAVRAPASRPGRAPAHAHRPRRASARPRLASQVAGAAARRASPTACASSTSAPLADPALSPPAVARRWACARRPTGPLPERWRADLRGQRLLLLLDNFEHVCRPRRRWSPTCWRRARRLKVLATSRAPLRVSGEQEFPVPPLALPDPTPGRPRRAADAVRGGGACSSSGRGPCGRLRADRRERAGRGGDLPPAGRAAAGHRAGRRAGAAAAAAGAAGPAGAPAPAADRRGPRPAGPPADAARDAIDWSYDLLAPRGAGAVPPAGGVRRRLHAGGGGGGRAAQAPGRPRPTAWTVLAALVDRAWSAQEARPGRRARASACWRPSASTPLERLERERRGRGRPAGARVYFLALAEAAEPPLRGPSRRRGSTASSGSTTTCAAPRWVGAQGGAAASEQAARRRAGRFW